ncbi:MBL fold metallo-hydrolase [Pseudorhodoplanes sp.]|jgi:7,8-dihydropterin-6-yl-methyl-4-(beta-D-ribofuranosyl)aminobenzene 5'-phosphate synthase|uniref:MBL fold metallo-hydrolase n=1 Tax=Pseudorhodoplanes sp. TaxID=1934341 RepID=UPI002B575840|nr:MBL fold metallo-hydrolase [Pseudorhodoplanes sp.]HWV40742.1 MBL fold metallo-hydrolase [Pseudorhodoplanes sp.]
MTSIARRDFLKHSFAATAFAAVAGEFACIEFANAAPIQVPTVDKLSLRVLIDSSHDIFLKPMKIAGITSQPPAKGGRGATFRDILHNQWGLSLFATSQRGNEERNLFLDFGYSPEALLNNIEILKIEPSKANALIVSHGHFDHYGGLLGFLAKFRDQLPADIKLYAGGEDNFCQRLTGPQNALSEFGVLDRRELAAKKIPVVLAESPTVVADHAFTTGKIKRTSKERVLPNTMVQFGIKDGLGCNASHYAPAELQGKIVPDEHIHEHATVYNIKDKGLVVISSCGHVGIVNSARQAQEVSGIKKIHALVGGFHLGPAPKDYLEQVVGEIKELDPDAIIPMHCSGTNFIQTVQTHLPDRLVLSTTGSQLTFGA